MKKILAALLTAALTLSLAACAGTETPETDAPNIPSSPAQQEQESTPAQEESSQPEGGAFTVGDAVTLDDIVVTLVDVSESAGGEYMKPDDGKVFIICEFNIENNSGEDLAVSSIMSFTAYIDDYSTTIDYSAVLSSGKGQLDGSVAAGKKMNGVVGYEADEDWETIEITFAPNVFLGEKAVFVYAK